MNDAAVTRFAILKSKQMHSLRNKKKISEQ
jgi:hypothetical protein